MKDNTSIPISPERGIDPHLTTCIRCGGEGQDIILGVLMTNVDNDGDTHYCPRGKTGRHVKDLPRGKYFMGRWTEVTDTNLRIPSGLCKDCDAEVKAHAKVITDGGVFFHCTECGRQGVIRPGVFADEVRRVNKAATPKPCGVEFDNCKEHGTTH